MAKSKASDRDGGINRRQILECMTWAGTGVLWTVAGGVPRSLGIIDQALAAEPSKLTFLQISDSHIGFNKPANPNSIGTLQEAIGKIKTLPARPSFMIHSEEQLKWLEDDVAGRTASTPIVVFAPATSAICRKRRNSTTPITRSPRLGSTCIMCRASTISSTKR